ncbi:DUF2510 domain-containing protein [Protaetiibacter intestinalis]|nr:DUF2510 domain-containing protein [Protaetiibacter intestinalis]
MSSPDAALPAEGWHPDPADAARERWWDGVAWTEFTREAPPVPGPIARRIHVREQIHRPPDASTRAVAWIAWSPGWIVFVLLPIALLGLASALASLLVPTLAGLIVGVLLALAWRDRRQLYDRGFPRRPALAWMLLGPVGYLVARWRALGEGRTEIVLCVAQLALIGVGWFIYEAITLGLGALGERLSETP